MHRQGIAGVFEFFDKIDHVSVGVCYLGKRKTLRRVCKWLSEVKYSRVRTHRPSELMPMSSA